jgi:methylthioribose-1-phosphate isomerase
VNIDGMHYRTIWMAENQPDVVKVIDQRSLPFALVIEELRTVDEVVVCIRDMHIRGAGLIGVAAAFGMYLSALAARDAAEADFPRRVAADGERLKATRPTAVNLAWSVERQLAAMGRAENRAGRIEEARRTAMAIADEDADFSRRIGLHGLPLLRAIHDRKGGGIVNVLTHCNAGWLAFVDHGTATAPIYAAHDGGIPVHVWVDETRPRNQGARLTAWELGQHGVPNTLIVDNAGGHLMQHGMVDIVIVGSDRTTRTGDAANKIGTYLKALAARDNGVPFYVALPSSTIDWAMRDGIREIPVEERDPREVSSIEGWSDGALRTVQLTVPGGKAANYGFDVTPARLVTGLITERGICEASERGILGLFPERKEEAVT